MQDKEGCVVVTPPTKENILSFQLDNFLRIYQE